MTIVTRSHSKNIKYEFLELQTIKRVRKPKSKCDKEEAIEVNDDEELVMIFDTETSGLPNAIDITNLDGQPYIVQLSYIIYNVNTNELEEIVDLIIKIPMHAIISERSLELHKITKEISLTKGVEIEYAMDKFFSHLSRANKIIGHNVQFDIRMLMIELIRLIQKNTDNDVVNKYKNYLHTINTYSDIYCTMWKALNGGFANKIQKLTHLHTALFGQKAKDLHNSLNDILVTLRCYVKMNYDVDLMETCSEFKKQFSKLIEY